MRRGMFRCEPVEGQSQYCASFAKRVIVLTSDVHRGEDNANGYALRDKACNHYRIRHLLRNLAAFNWRDSTALSPVFASPESFWSICIRTFFALTETWAQLRFL